ncbi:MAG: redox-sensing transcriptional repressor Rex [Muribaculaceae bacterium]|nr:redox-sensing transcriptional repressor Rex [Muribaculaceae bacterium]
MLQTETRAQLPEPTLRRLPWYLSYVSMLNAAGVEYVSSTLIARELDVDASQIAKDLSFLDIKGKTRIGYDVASLEQVLQDFLGFKKSHNAVIAGVGSLGSALLADSGLQRYGLNIVAALDVNKEKIGTSIAGVPVYDMSRLADIRRELSAEIGILTVPVEVAQEVTDMMVGAGFKALWNFTPIRIRTAGEIVVSNTSIYAHLALMYNRLAQSGI